MHLKCLQIVNYKNFKNEEFLFERGANTIIGENDSGKSNAMKALRILLDSSYYYNTKRLKEDDFSDCLSNWKGHWIIISAVFSGITSKEKTNEICKDIVLEKESELFIKNLIRCGSDSIGTVTLFIRPQKQIRKKLSNAENQQEFQNIRNGIKLSDYEFWYTSRSQIDFTDNQKYKKIVGDIEQFQYNDPDNEDLSIIGSKIDITEFWQYISVEFIDALRDVAVDLKKPKNPIRRIIDTIKTEISKQDSNEIKQKIKEVNDKISGVNEISNIGNHINSKLNEMIGMVYSPNVFIESQLKDDIELLSRFLTIIPSNKHDIDSLGLGHLNMLYVALKLVEFEVNRNRELVNIMVIEEPEAHIHTHIQKTLFSNLKVSKDFTQILMTTHSTHLSEISEINKVNILKTYGDFSEVMQPSFELNQFGKNILNSKDVTITQCLERYLDAKRSVLLFSKGVILVEGDGEEILIPALTKKVMGVSLDELGIGLINIGSVGFENVACIFHEKRLKRYCSIITDLDKCLDGSEKCSKEAEKRGVGRQKKLTKLFNDNKYVDMFYAPYTLEIDFANESNNIKYINKVIDIHYADLETKKEHMNNLEKDVASRYDSVMTIVRAMRKGWYATVLARIVYSDAIIPNYILEAIAFSSQEVINQSIKLKMIEYSLKKYDDENVKEMLNLKQELKSVDEINQFIENFCNKFEDDVVAIFIKMAMKYES
ncbi:ATP-dependent OLD family endonuclease [Campylobacter blaseri]|uniref:ATP-dependent endonuclease n=1 Tax=Campylobacter blaseri TaxID=2042961 RepID=A0A2P8QZ57_9BACT|nr:AAA family ATPase [Campylobacter blaseri]PSM51530.1 ATP-dependent endonuclease [Campylobacter blaseri]PSM53323.1 ATP-dependent endonuclease [Campylobacter blaseri]QKF86617.1 ATP-dependent OLD family endonuclease [Campylobacter blaseri]